MKKYLITLVVVGTAAAAQAQTPDTLYFDRDWNPVPDRSAAAYLRPRPVAEGSRFYVRDYCSNGPLQMDGYFTSADAEIRSGHFSYYDSLGRKTSEGDYTNDKRDGVWVYYQPETGAISMRQTYRDGGLNGLQQYYLDGTLRRREDYESGRRREGHSYAPDGREIPFVPYEDMPAFKGDINRFLSRNVRYPEDERQAGIEGRVIVRFVVDENGEVVDPQIRKSVSPGLDAEALRVVRTMPAWKPAKEEGTPVKVYYNLPISFRLRR